MSTGWLLDSFDKTVLLFPTEWSTAALVLALISVWVVIALFAYLNHATRKPYFSLWTVSWMFYSVYLASSIGLEESPRTPLLLMTRGSCIGISALFMFWGSFQLTKHPRQQRELGLACGMIVLWSFVSAYLVTDHLWITFPLFTLLALAGVYTGWFYIRQRRRYLGARILGCGFILWGLHLLAFPLAELEPRFMACGYFTSAILAVLITVGMVVEQEVNVSEHSYRELFDLSGDAIFLLDPTSLQIVEANLAALRLTDSGYSHLHNRPFQSLSPDLAGITDQPTLLQTVNQPCHEFRLTLPSGTTIVCEGRASLTSCPRGEMIQVSVRDITQHKLTEESLRDTAARLAAALTELRNTQGQLVQQERLRALEQMASGVAHDFNNALAKTLGFNELLLAWPENLNDQNKVKKFLQMSNAAARDAVQIVNRLREFYRQRKVSEVYQPVDINEVIEQAIILTQPRWKDQAMSHGITIQLEISLHDAPPIRGQAAELREVVVNLILNAVDALQQDGTLTVSTRVAEGHVAFSIADTGTGMTAEVRERCLEPFFSTKSQQGTGLGLAIVYGIIHRHGGTIDIQSAPNEGTTITARLPLPAPTTDDSTSSLPATNNATPAPLKVLVVEDDPQVLHVQSEYLRGDGHTVITAANGRDGLDKFRANRFDLVVTDRALPELSGDQLAQAVKELHPETPVVIVTGFADGRPTPADAVLGKPITQAALRETIAQVLHSRTIPA